MISAMLFSCTEEQCPQLEERIFQFLASHGNGVAASDQSTAYNGIITVWLEPVDPINEPVLEALNQSLYPEYRLIASRW